MKMLNVLLFILLVVPMPLLIGLFWSAKDKSCSRSHHLLSALFYGMFLEFALFEILAIPMVFFKCSLLQLSVTWLALSLVLAVFSFCKSLLPALRKTGTLTADETSMEAADSDGIRSRKWFSPLLPVVLLCIFLQFFYVTFNQHIDEDDAFYVATATTAVETNTLMEYDPYTGDLYSELPARYVLSAWPLYLAVLSTLSGGIHPTILAHLLIPGFVLLFAYCIYALIAKSLFPDDCSKQHLFLLLISLLLSFSGFSVYSSGTFLFVRAWQGKALVASITQPTLFYLCRCAMKEDNGTIFWFYLFCAVTASCMFSSMGVILATVPIGIYTLIYAVPQRKWRYFYRSAFSCLYAVFCGIAYLILS
ncbi:MAG: DUF6077 domain-containing protein [Clostridiales bacterium]|nr:DUF6077 domain-containing protein [Clostridiales bacterium]